MPAANLDRLLTLVDPARLALEIEQPNHLAREQYHLRDVIVQDFDEFLSVAVDYYRHHASQVMGRKEIRDEEAYGEVRRILDSRYQGGLQAAYCAARKCMNGGMPAILNSIRDAFIQEAEEQYFNHAFSTCVNELDDEEVERLMQQYLQRNRSFSGQQEPDIRPRQLARNARDVIRAHVAYTRKVRSQWHL